MIDTSRHYLSVPEIQRIIDTLPMNKFNKLHWHIIDSQSFPFDSPSEPEMVKGAFTPKLVYTSENLKTLNEYARRRGVEIIFEVDVPGHAASWGAGKPELLADCMA
jgi:hexosaminidase